MRTLLPITLLVITLLFPLADSSAGSVFGPEWKPTVHLALSPHPAKQVDWNAEILYFILIDRFCNGDSSNDVGNNPLSHVPYDPAKGNIEALKTYQGGDLQGVIDQLDYLQSLGITAIWLSPVFDNSDHDFVGWWPYHGYSPVDFFAVDEHFGSLATLKELMRQVHQRGMKIILDMVYNHVAPDHPWVMDPHNWEELGYKHWFHPHSGKDASTSITNWQDQQQLENRELNGLPDLAQENPHVYDFLLDLSKFWIVETNCDGFRFDAVKHIPKSFWRKICRDLHKFAGNDFLLLGEVFEGNTDYVAGYAGLGFNALFDIPMYYTINRVFAQGSTMNLLSEQLERNHDRYGACSLSTLLDNHDVARFSYWAKTDVEAKIAQAVTFAFSLSGLPMLYYGTEVALPGAARTNEKTGAGQDYLNRLMMPWSAMTESSENLLNHIKKVLHTRRHSPAMQTGKTVELYKDYGVYAYLRYLGPDAKIIILNNSSFPESRKIPLRGIISTTAGSFTDVLSGQSFLSAHDTLAMTLAAHSSYLLTFHAPLNTMALRNPVRQCVFTERLTEDLSLVRFSYRADKKLTSVSLAGDFNAWSPTASPMRDAERNGLWQVAIPLKAGRYRYKFVLDGTKWIPDPQATDFELDPYGDRNSVITVEKH